MKNTILDRKLVKMHSCKKLIIKNDKNFSHTKGKGKITINILKKIITLYEKSKKTKNNKNSQTNNIRTIENKNKCKTKENLYGHNNHNYSPDIFKTLNNKYNYVIEQIKKSKNLKQVCQKLSGDKLLTPIPKTKKCRGKKIDEKELKLYNEAIHTAIVIRRYEYNDYLYKRREAKIKSALTKRLYRKYPFRKVVRIQKNYKGYSVRQIRKNVDNLKFHECSLEVFLLLVLSNINTFYKRRAFKILKKIKRVKKEKCLGVDDELKFEDKINLKLTNRYYNSLRKNNLKSNKIIKKRANSED